MDTIGLFNQSKGGEIKMLNSKKIFTSLLKDKRAIFSELNVVGAVIIAVMVVTVIAIASFLALTSLQSANLFGTGSANTSTYLIIGNITTGTTNFFTQIPVIFTILGVVALIGAIVLIIFYVGRMGGTTPSGGL